MRIARAMALAGIDSRRKCEQYVTMGEVCLNGQVIHDLGRQVDIDNDEITFRGRPLSFERYVYYVLHKPKGYTTTARDEHAKKTVFDLLPHKLTARTKNPQSRTRVFTVGRLDKDSTGLLLFTNDGELANRLTHPRYGVGKWYEVRLDRTFDDRDGLKLRKGVQLEDGMAKAEKLHSISKRVLRILICEGKNREVRRLFEKVGYEVVELCRVAFGPLLLGAMPPGQGRFLNSSEVRRLKEAVPEPAKKSTAV